MERTSRKLPALVALCALLVCADGPVVAQTPRPRPAVIAYGAGTGKIAAVIAGIAGAGIALGVGFTLAMRHESHSVTGCARSGPNGLILMSDSDKQSYSLLGDVAGIKPGDRFRLSGKKGKEKSSGTHQFLVEKVAKDFGACAAPDASH
jgi:hypothetical protein